MEEEKVVEQKESVETKENTNNKEPKKITLTFSMKLLNVIFALAGIVSMILSKLCLTVEAPNAVKAFFWLSAIFLVASLSVCAVTQIKEKKFTFEYSMLLNILTIAVLAFGSIIPLY